MEQLTVPPELTNSPIHILRDIPVNFWPYLGLESEAAEFEGLSELLTIFREAVNAQLPIVEIRLSQAEASLLYWAIEAHNRKENTDAPSTPRGLPTDSNHDPKNPSPE